MKDKKKKERKHSLRYQKELRSKGICSRCWKRPLQTTWLCAECAAKCRKGIGRIAQRELRKEMATMYLETGMSYKEVAEEFGVSSSMVQSGVHEFLEPHQIRGRGRRTKKDKGI